MDELRQKFQESLANFNILLEKVSKADQAQQPVNQNDLYNCMSAISNMISHVHDRINNLSDSVYTHTSDGHLPKIKGAEQMARAVKNLGLDKEYVVQPNTIYASNGRNIVAQVDLSPSIIKASKNERI